MYKKSVSAVQMTRKITVKLKIHKNVHIGHNRPTSSVCNLEEMNNNRNTFVSRT